jgi:predicted phosphodiesterase
MRFAIFSDLHNNAAGLERVLTDAAEQRADRLICLGDVGRDERLFGELRRQRVECLFGNWEVSGMRYMDHPTAAWVRTWRASLRYGLALFCHATPDIPASVTTTVSATHYMAGGVGWSTLFPRLHLNEGARWSALAALEEADLRVAFHGHTHVQLVWCWQRGSPDTQVLRPFSEPTTFVLEPGEPGTPNRYLVGVGSAGQPDDGPWLRYVLYDEASQQVTLRRLKMV